MISAIWKRHGTETYKRQARRLSFETLDRREMMDGAGLVFGDADILNGVPDSNRDGLFDQRDIVAALAADKYLTSSPADISEGDWNRDGVFNQLDIVFALATDSYLKPAASAFPPSPCRIDAKDDGHAYWQDQQATVHVLTNDTPYCSCIPCPAPVIDPTSVEKFKYGSARRPQPYDPGAIRTDGSIVFREGELGVGTHTFYYTVMDKTASITSDPGRVQLHVRQPVDANSDSVVYKWRNHDDTWIIDVLGNDKYHGRRGDNSLEIRSIALQSPTHAPNFGSLDIVGGRRQLQYSPNGDIRSYAETWRVTVGVFKNGRWYTDTAQLKINVSAGKGVDARPNGAPVAVGDFTTVPNGKAVSVDVLGNDSDPNGDELLVSGCGQGLFGYATCSSGSPDVYYHSRPGFVGTDSFTYTITDGRLSSTATVTVDVTPPPISDSVVRRFIDAGRVTLMAHGGQYLAAEGGGGAEVVANRGAVGGWEIFTIELLDGNAVSLKTWNGHYLCAEGGGGGELNATRTAVGGWERFEVIGMADGAVAFRTFNGHYLSAEGGGGGEVVANRSAVVGWETFRFSRASNQAPHARDDHADVRNGEVVDIPVLNSDTDPDGDALVMKEWTQPLFGHVEASPDNSAALRYHSNPGFVGTDSFTYSVDDGHGGTATAAVYVNVQPPGGLQHVVSEFINLGRVTLRSHNDWYLCAEGGGGGELLANRRSIGAWEVFDVERVEGNVVALRTSDGYYLCAEGGGGREVNATRRVVGDWERFEVIGLFGGAIALRASNGQYVCAENGGGGEIVANRNAVVGWETFHFEKAPL